MRKSSIILIVFLVFGSCVEELDPLDPNIEKIYGINRNSWPNGITQNADGSYLIYGRAERTIMDFENIYGEKTKDAEMPLLIKIDQDGNEIMTRTFPIGQIEYEINPAANFYDLKIWRAQFIDALEMENGKYLAVFDASSTEWIAMGFMILDESLNVVKIQLLEDFEMEFQETQFVSRFEHRVFQSPHENEVLLLAQQSIYLDSTNFWAKWETGFYSIFRLSLDGTLIDIYDYENDNQILRAENMIFDAEGNAIVVGTVNYSAKTVFIHKIDLQTGNILDEVELNTNYPGQDAPKILSVENGYVLGEIQDTEYPNRFAISFLDKDFNITNRVLYPPKKYNECYLNSFIPMQSNGFCALSYTCNGPATIFRLDNNGNEIWRWERGFNSGDGSLDGDLIEAADGGIMFLGGKEFNSSGHKITLIKLDANGNL